MSAVLRHLPSSRSGRIAVAAVLLIAALAVVGPWLAPHAADKPVGPPYHGPSGQTLLGTDFLGRDVLSRTLAGGRTVFFLGGLATLIAYAAGLLIGLSAGISGRWLDGLLMRSNDVLLSFPPLIFVLLLGTAIGTGYLTLILGVAAIQAPSISRIIRTATLEQSLRGFVEAAVARGESTAAILRREILPNIARPIAADAPLRMTYSVILIASLSFLGLGPAPPTADWGLMIAENRDGITLNPLVILAPAVLLGALTIALNVAGDAIADAPEDSE